MATPPDLDYFDKVNYVIDSWAQPCEAPWYIYISTLKPALLAAFITLITFGWDDVLRGWARPPDRHARRRGSKKRGRKGRKGGAGPDRRWYGVRGFPEIGELIGRKLPGSEQVKGINWSNGARTLWRIDSVSQQFLFYWLVADVTNEFAFEWTSLLYETRWCKESARGRFSYQKGPPELVSPGFWNEIVYTIRDYEFPPPVWNIGTGIVGFKGATITFSVDWRPQDPANPPSSFSTRIVDKDTGEVWGTDGPTIPDALGGATHVISAHAKAGRRFGIQGFADGNWAIAQDGAITGIEDML